SFLWQEYVIEAMGTALGASLSGTSNTFLAYKHDLEAMGTNAHELPMALAALANGDEALHESQYRVLELWQKSYGGELLIMLPDTFGTTQFLEGAPDWVADRSEEHTSELQSLAYLVCRLLLEKKKK